ncbi:MAG TPA: histidine--tRNA ligase [Terriglobales bacterium]|nr:histidine--tRNA ligase [Terriglobales bacterium]
MKLTAIKGMRDLLPDDTRWFQRLEAAVRSVFALYNFDEIRTPVLEPLDLFRRAVGEETDIVGKEMYTFADRDGALLTLRPEATASTVRAYVEHRLWERPGLTRLYYMGPMFRRERPQKGRYRQFYQVGAEVLGGDDAWIDYELLAMLRMLLERCGITGAELILNSVGCAQDRPRYHAALRAALADKLPGMCADCQRRAVTNPLRVLDCKVPADQPIIAALPTIQDFLDDKCRAHFAALQRLLTAGGIAFRLDPRLVRGLDYYTSTAFEFVHGALGSQNALLGGGRYDGLAQELGAPATVGGAIGFALGEDRFVMAMQQADQCGRDWAVTPVPESLAALIIPLSGDELAPALQLAERLRRRGLRLELAAPGRKLGKSLELATRLQAPFAVIAGAQEVAGGQWQVKRLADASQQSLAEPALAALLGATS